MRIAYVLLDPGIPFFGTKGASVHAQEVVRGFRALGHEVTVFCTRLGEAVPADLAELDIVHIGLDASHVDLGTGHARDRGTRVGGRSRTRVGERERALMRVSDTIAERVSTDHAGIDLVYERYSLFSTAGATISQRLDIPLLLEVNAPLIDEQRLHRGLVHDDHAVRTTAISFGQARRIVCVSDAVADWVRRDYPGLADIAVVPNGVNTERISPGSRDDAVARIGFVGTLKPWHGVDRLLATCADLTGDFHLDIVGHGPAAEDLHRQAAELRLGERLTFHGVVSPADMPAHLHRFDIAVAPYPSGPNYFSPLKVYEYMAAGLPTVASAVGALPGLLGGGTVTGGRNVTEPDNPHVTEPGGPRVTDTGILVPPDDLGALTAALQTLIDDPALRSDLGRRARAEALAEHSWTSRCQDILDPILLEAV